MDDCEMWLNCIFGNNRNENFYCDYCNKTIDPTKCENCLAFCNMTHARYIIRKYIREGVIKGSTTY